MASWTGVSYQYGGSGLTNDRVRAILAYSSLTENDKVTYHFVVGGHGYGAYSTSAALSTSLSCSGQTTYTTSGQGGNFSNGTNVWLNPTSGNREYSWYRTTSAQTRTVNFSLKSTGSTISGTSSGSLTITIPALPTYTVKYSANGGSGAPSSQTKTYGKTLTLSSTKPTRTGYTFDHWDTKSDGSGTNYSPGGSYTANAAVTLYARWTVKSYTLTYNANGGSVSPTSRTLNYGANYVLPTPTRTNYNFLGWYTAASGGTKVTTSTTMGAANTTIYAHWELDACTLTANANGGSISSTTGWTGTGTTATKTIVIGNTYGTLPTVSRTGYTFSKWNTASDGSGSTKTSNSTMGSSNTTIYAQWTGPNSYTLTAKAGGGSISSATGWTGTGATATKTITYNNAYGTLPTVSRTGYTLQGWYTASSGGTQVTTSTKMGGAATAIYAHWNPKNYTLKAMANGGSISSTTGWTGTGVEATKIIACDNAYGTLPTVSQTGYTFQGWYTASSGGTQVTTSNTMGAANTTIYAHWQANNYVINYNPNPPIGTTALGIVDQTSHIYGVESQLSADTYTIPDYIFKGWATSPTGTVRYTSGQSVSKVTTVNNQIVQLYAVWEYSYEAPTFGETISAIRCDFEIVEEESFIPQEEGYYELISIDSDSYMPPYQLTSDTQKQSGKYYYKLQPDDLGKYALISIDIQNIGLDKIDNSNTRYIRFYYKSHSDNSYIICDYKTITTPGIVYGLLVPGTGSINERGELDSQTQYDIKIEANIEKVENNETVVKASRSITTFISVAKFLIDMDINGGDKIAFGKSASKVGFECDMDAYFNDNTYIQDVYNNDSSLQNILTSLGWLSQVQ